MGKYVDVDSAYGTTWSDEGLFCPFCQAEQDDLCEISGAYTEDGGETDCCHCTKKFTFTTYIKYARTSRKPRGEAA